MRTVIAVIATLLVLAILGLAVVYSGAVNVAASSSHGGIATWLLSTTKHASVERRAADVTVPDLGDAALQRAGVSDFDAMCAGCHGAPGQEPGAMGQGLNPPAPDLAEEAAEMSAAELFWVTKHGIRMTGMPAWGASHDDDALWPVVAFTKERLPELDAAAYRRFLADAGGAGHHAPEAAGHHNDDDSDGHEHAAEPADESTDESADEHDHSSHEH